MADYRQIHTCIWKDSWFIDLPHEHNLLFIYLFSNERANLTGLYDLSLRIIAFETDLDPDTIAEGLERFAADGKVHYEDGMVWVPTLLRHNARNITSPKIQTHLKGVINTTRDCPLKARWIVYYNDMVAPEYRIDTLSIPDPEREGEHVLSPVHDPVPARDPVPAPKDEPPVPPAVVIYGDLTGEIVNWRTATTINEAVGDDPTNLDKWKEAIDAWLLEGYRKKNIRGMLDWFRDGVPDRRRNAPRNRRNGNGPAGLSEESKAIAAALSAPGPGDSGDAEP